MRLEVELEPDPADHRGRQAGRFAIEPRDQCVAFCGVSSSVAVLTQTDAALTTRPALQGRAVLQNRAALLTQLDLNGPWPAMHYLQDISDNNAVPGATPYRL